MLYINMKLLLVDFETKHTSYFDSKIFDSKFNITLMNKEVESKETNPIISYTNI